MRTGVGIMAVGLFLAVSCRLDADVKAQSRGAWFFDETNTSATATPSSLKYFKFYDVLPDEVNLQVAHMKDFSMLAGKRVFVGYGIVDPRGENCRVFLPSQTGMDNNVTICLPWWRIERTYALDKGEIKPVEDFFKLIARPRPPLLVDVCREWKSGPAYNGGKVTCTTYYDRFKDKECYENPMQPKCYVNNCSKYLMENCTYVGNALGEKDDLTGAMYIGGLPSPTDAKVGLQTQQFECPAGTTVPYAECLDESTVFMYPYECAPDNPETAEDDGEYIYCDDKNPQYDANGDIIGFVGRCSDGRTVMCEAGAFSSTKTVCTDPVYEKRVTSEVETVEIERNYATRYVNVYSGEPDIYASDPNCVRANTVEDARDQQLYVHIVGSGSLDDDIYVLRHRGDGSHAKIYCNMQHNEDRGSKKAYNGEILQCIDNDGHYTFDKTVPIDAADIVSVQQNSEAENDNGTPFALGRRHYGSSKVVIDNILVAPRALPADYPSYPRNNDGKWLRTWDNVTSTLSLLFPFAGAYHLYFYNGTGALVAEAEINMEDFRQIGNTGNLQLKLARSMELAPGFDYDDSTSCIEDDWVEWGGGVFGGKGSKGGEPCKSPNDGFVQSRAVTKVIIKDLLTGAVTPVPLVYPLAYPNRVFISKLKVYEHRKYRCYEPFPVAKSPN